MFGWVSDLSLSTTPFELLHATNGKARVSVHLQAVVTLRLLQRPGGGRGERERERGMGPAVMMPKIMVVA